MTQKKFAKNIKSIPHHLPWRPVIHCGIDLNFEVAERKPGPTELVDYICKKCDWVAFNEGRPGSKMISDLTYHFDRCR